MTVTPDEFRARGHQLVDWIADYRARVASLPVMAQTAPGEVKSQLPSSPPCDPENFDDILREIELTFDIHAAAGSYLGGVHFELTGDDVTECIGGAAGVREEDLDKNYASLCDPRLNYRQALEMSFRLARRMASRPTLPP